MATYRLAGRKFSRHWRRGKNYSDHELQWLARKRSLEAVERKGCISILDPKTKKVVALFNEVVQAESNNSNERLQVFAALKFSLVFMLLFTSQIAMAQTYQEKVIAGVIMAEARGEGLIGMTAVAEVISRRAFLKQQTPLEIVTVPYAFSSMRGTTAAKIARRFQKDIGYAKAIKLAHKVCFAPEQFSGITKKATHFDRTGTHAYWTRNKNPVAVIGKHSFYVLK